MGKRTKNTKTYRVRVVNPAPPPGQRARVLGERHRNPMPKHGYKKTVGDYQVQYLEDTETEDGPTWAEIVIAYTGKIPVTLSYVDQELLENDWKYLRTNDDVAELLDQNGYDEYGNSSRGKPNPAFRYAAVPVTDAGADTVYVARGHRRADMVRNVAHEVPGDAVVDLQRTRTFGTKHEAQTYGSTVSPRVRSLSRRIGS
jgi:hypothetical protein